MKNPYDINLQHVEFHFFDQMTQNVDKFMIEKYPTYDLNLSTKIQKLEEIQLQSQINFKTQKETINSLKEESLLWFKTEMKKFMETEYPDVSSKLLSMAEQLEKDLKNLHDEEKKFKKVCDKKMNEFDSILANIKLYTSLCEDVYQLRDKMEVIQKEVSVFTKKLKKAFE
jgi:hypothetical protein